MQHDAGWFQFQQRTGMGIDHLLELIGGLVDEGPPLQVKLDPQDGEAVAWLYRNGRIVSREDSEEGVSLAVRLDRQAIGRFEQRWPGALR